MDLADTTDIFARLNALLPCPYPSPVDDGYGKYPLDTVLTLDQVKEKAGKKFIQKDYDMLMERSILIHDVLLGAYMDDMNPTPLAYCCSYKGFRFFAYHDWDDRVEFFFLHAVRQKGVPYFYCDLFYRNAGKPQEKVFFEFMENPDAYRKKYLTDTLHTLEQLREVGYKVSDIRINEVTNQYTVHVTIDIPDHLKILNRPSLIPPADDDECMRNYQQRNIDSANDSITRQRYYFTQYWRFADGTRQWLLSTAQNFDANTQEFDYGNKREHYIIVCTDFTLDALKEGISEIDRVTHSEIPTAYDIYRIADIDFQPQEGTENVLEATTYASKYWWWKDPTQDEQVEDRKTGEAITKPGVPRTFRTMIAHSLYLTLEQKEDMFDVTVHEVVKEKTSPASIYQEEEEKVLSNRSLTYSWNRWEILTNLRDAVHDLRCRYGDC